MNIISDTSVVIDIIEAKLVEATFSLPYLFGIPDIVFAQELESRHDYLLQCGLICKTMSGELIAEAYQLRQKFPRLSLNDALGLVLAKAENCQLLTNDKMLRKVAEQMQVKVNGIIWLIQEIKHHQNLTLENIQLVLNRLRDAGSRLPWDLAEKLLLPEYA